MKWINNIKKIVLILEENFEKIFCSVSLSIIAISLMIDIFFRYVLRSPLTAPQELVRFLFVWFIYLGVSYGIKEGAHIRLSHHVTLFPYFIQKITRIIADIIWLSYSFIIFFLGINLVYSMFQFPYRSQVFEINLAYIYMIIPFGFFLMGIRILVNIYKILANKIPPYTIQEERQILD
jgi:TRAP-type C4-dicarboxylate transport system permease small subunit